MCGGTALVNLCGVCAGGTTGLSNDHPLDCRGICDGDYSTNSCGVCQHNMEQIDYKDCVGQCYGTALVCIISIGMLCCSICHFYVSSVS